MDCSPKCRKTKHDDLNFSAIINIGQEDAAKVQAILPRVCSNFARVADQCGRTALHLAASCGKCDILEWLVREQGAELDSKDLESGWTPLHRSVFFGFLDCAVKLIQLGSDLGCLDKEGLSPLGLIQLDSPFQITSGVQAKVVSSYKTSLEDELKLEVGDVIRDIQITGDRYWTGNLKGKRGHFPRNCVELLLKDYPLELFTWGSNTNFTLGHRDESTRHAPEILECAQGDAKLSIKEVVMCKFHSIFLSADGRVFTCGHGRGGRLGHGSEKTFLEPQEVTALKGLKCVSIAAGQDHTVVVTEEGSVYTCGLNDSQQLGHSPAPKQSLLPKLVQMKSWKGKVIVGAAAGHYHSVFFTQTEVYSCGLNAGQLGHPKGEQYQTFPRQVSGLAAKDVVISEVTCSDGATVCATVKGDIFLLNMYACRRIISRFTDLTHLAVIGGKLDKVSPQEVSKKFADELGVTLLNSRGMVFQWKPEFSSLRECCWTHKRPITVRDFAIGKQFLIVSGNGEAFICQPSGTRLSPIKADSKKTNRSSSISPKTTESTLAQSPPTFSPFSNSAKEKGDTFAQSPPNTTPLSLLAKGEPKRDVVEYCLERIPFIHRGLRVFTDSKSRGFALLQIAAKEGLKKLPQVSPSQMQQHLTQLFDDMTCEDDIHDVEFLVKGQVIPAHGFVLASRSPKCHQIICGVNDVCPQGPEKRMRTIPLHENVDHSAVMSWLKRLYGGEEISDKELFVKRVSPKGKNGYHSIGKEQNKLKQTMKEDKIVSGKKIVPESDNENLIPDHVLTDLAYLANRDLDDLTAPSLDGEDFSLDDGTDHVKRAVEMKQRNNRETKTSVRKDEEADLSNGCELMAFSRSNCPELYDVAIVSEDGTELQCHKCILVARLDYFRSMWACGWLESSAKSKTITLPFPTAILEVVLDFLYSGHAGKVKEITDLELLGHILIVADQLLISRLREICEAVIANLGVSCCIFTSVSLCCYENQLDRKLQFHQLHNSVTLRNVNELLEFSLLYNANQLRDVCTEFITNNLGSLMEARTLHSLSDEALAEVSRAYRSLVAGMAWRVITPSDVHDSILHEILQPSHGKRRKSTGRKKSSKSESDQDITFPEAVQENNDEAFRSSGKENDEGIVEHEISRHESSVVDNNGELSTDLDCTGTDEPANQEHQGALAQTADNGGLWYRKHSPEVIKPKKKGRDKRQPATKSVEDLEEKQSSHKEEPVTSKVSSPEKPAWSSKTSLPSPSATSLKDIIEQERSQASIDVNSVTEVSPLKGAFNSPDQRLATSPQGGSLRWSTGGRQSQKQRKRSKSKTLDESGGQSRSAVGNTSDEAGATKEEKTAPAWGGVGKGPAPVKSLRDLMQEEEQRQSKKETAFQEMAPASTSRISSASGKSMSARKKLNWRPQPGFYVNNPHIDGQEKDDSDCDHPSGLPLSPPKSAWQFTPIACSPPSSLLAFSAILESQEQENTNLDKVSKKPFHSTQLEERAMEELLQYYGGKDNACEFVTVQRIPSTAARPVWRKERSPSVISN